MIEKGGYFNILTSYTRVNLVNGLELYIIFDNFVFGKEQVHKMEILLLGGVNEEFQVNALSLLHKEINT